MAELNQVTPLLEARNLKKIFKVSKGALHAVDGVDLKIYPLCRHEIHGELNRAEVFADVTKWLNKYI